MLETVPFVPLAGQVRVGVAIFSYDGTLKFGVTGDYDTATDIRILCQGIEDGMAELGAAACGSAPPRERKRGPRAVPAAQA
jgi:diacylglycerol O-acyltransferase